MSHHPDIPLAPFAPFRRFQNCREEYDLSLFNRLLAALSESKALTNPIDIYLT